MSDYQSPLGVSAVVSSASVRVTFSNSARFGIIFINPSTTVTIYVVPDNLTAVVGQGVPVLPGSQVVFLGSEKIHFWSGWNAIASVAGTNYLTVLELL